MNILKKIQGLKTWQKVTIFVALGGIILTSNYYITKNIAENKEKQIISDNFNNFKTQVSKSSIEDGQYQGLILFDNNEYLNDSTLYKNNVVTGELSINSTKDKNFSIVNVYEKDNNVLVKGYKLPDDKYVVSKNEKINDLSFKFYKELPNLVIKEMQPIDLNKTKDGAFLIKLKDKELTKDILKDFGIEGESDAQIEYLVGFEKEDITKQAFKITCKSKDGQSITLEYTGKVDKVGTITDDGNANIKGQEGNVDDIIKQFTRKLEN